MPHLLIRSSEHFALTIRLTVPGQIYKGFNFSHSENTLLTGDGVEVRVERQFLQAMQIFVNYFNAVAKITAIQATMTGGNQAATCPGFFAVSIWTGAAALAQAATAFLIC